MTDNLVNLSKTEMICKLSIALKSIGFRKKRAYWYKELNDYIFCVNIQGSQWDSDGYYVNVGMSTKNKGKDPSLLAWTWRHRCKGSKGETNISLDEILLCIEEYLNNYLLDNNISAFLERNNATIVAQQYWI